MIPTSRRMVGSSNHLVWLSTSNSASKRSWGQWTLRKAMTWSTTARFLTTSKDRRWWTTWLKIHSST